MSTTTYSPPVVEGEDEGDELFVEQFALQDHPYANERLSPIIENIVIYISGWVARKILKSLK